MFLNSTKWLLLIPLRLSILWSKQSENTEIQKIHSHPEHLSRKSGKSEVGEPESIYFVKWFLQLSISSDFSHFSLRFSFSFLCLVIAKVF